jgi:hypothetical protein
MLEMVGAKKTDDNGEPVDEFGDNAGAGSDSFGSMPDESDTTEAPQPEEVPQPAPEAVQPPIEDSMNYKGSIILESYVKSSKSKKMKKI